MLFRLLSWPYVRKHALRSVLNVAGIALGVAVWIGIHAANRAVVSTFRQTLDRVAGAAQLQISAGRMGFAESVLDRVLAVPEVGVAAPAVEAVLETGRKGQGNILLLGVDMTGDAGLRSYDFEGEVDDPLTFLAQPDSLIVTREFAGRNGLAVGAKLPMLAMNGNRLFTVRGILKPGGVASAFGGNLAVMDIYAAQKVLGRENTFDRIDVIAREGVDVAECRAALEKALGPGFQVEPPAMRGDQLESVLRLYSRTADICSLFALFVGMFIIYNSFGVAVAERRGEIGILRGLGATRGQILRLFLAESAIAGSIGSAVGVAFGLAMARGVATYTSAVLAGMYGVADRVEEIAASPGLILGAWAAGVASSIVAALVPAREASWVDAAQTLQKGRFQMVTGREDRWRRWAAAVLGVVACLGLALRQGKLAFNLGYLCLFLAAVLLGPALARTIGRMLRPVLRWILPVEGALAADTLVHSPRRSSATTSALMVSIALALGMAGISGASYDSINVWLATVLNPDLFVTTSENLATAAFRFPASMLPDLEKIDGIRLVQPYRGARVLYKGKMVVLNAIDLVRSAPKDPAQAAMYRKAAGDGAFLVSENFAELNNVKVGDAIEVDSPGGTLRRPVAGTIRDFQSQQGTIIIDRELFRANWNDDSINVFRIYLEPGASGDAVKTRILEKFGGDRRIFVLTNADARAYVHGITEQWFRVTYIQIAVAVLVAILGIANTITISIHNRRRELAILKTVGGLRRQIRYAIWAEAVSIGAAGLILGAALGAMNLYYCLELVERDVAGIRFDYQFPFRAVALMVPVILVSAWLAAIGPAESALRRPLVKALEYE